MITPQLLEFIKTSLTSGQSREAITQALVQNGWSAEDIQQGFANIVTPAPAYSASVPTIASSIPTHSKLPLILGAVAVVAILAVGGGLVWASQQAKNNEASIANTASTTTENVVLDDTTLVSSSGTAPKITGSITIDNKLTFTAIQLSNLKTDLIKLYAKYNGQDKNAEPLKTQFGKELDAIFLKDLGVPNVTATNIGLLLYPEIAKILADIKSESSSKQSIQVNNSSSDIENSNVTASLLITDSLDKEGLPNINIKAGSKFYAIWKSTNADKAFLSTSITECPDSALNKKESSAKSEPVESYESGVLPDSLIGCKLNYTLVASNTLTGNQATAKAVITVVK